MKVYNFSAEGIYKSLAAAGIAASAIVTFRSPSDIHHDLFISDLTNLLLVVDSISFPAIQN